MNPKRDRLHISAYQSVETGLDWNHRYYIVYSNNASIFTRDLKELRRFLKIPKGVPSRDSLDSWLASLEAMDKERVAKKVKLAEPVPHVAVDGSFDPLAHDVDNDNTRMIT